MWYIVINQTKPSKRLYHIGGNILFNTPTMNYKKRFLYKTLRGAQLALKAIQNHIGNNLTANIEFNNETI